LLSKEIKLGNYVWKSASGDANILYEYQYTYIIFHKGNQTNSMEMGLLKRLPVMQLLKTFPAFYGTRRFITAFTRALHCSLSTDTSNQSTPLHPISLRSILILSNH
jgi:hypothetical protein